MEIKKLCVFCGAKPGIRPEYTRAAKALGNQMVAQRIGLVYGGGTVGLMGEIARTVADGLGHDSVEGIIPKALTPREIAGEMVGKTSIVTDMHTRKAMMAKLADGFIAMPGGFGTLEEVLEVITWQQLGFHTKPIGIYNAEGFFDPLLQFFEHCIQEGFIDHKYSNLLISADPANLIQKMRDFKPPASLLQVRLDSREPIGMDVDHSNMQQPDGSG